MKNNILKNRIGIIEFSKIFAEDFRNDISFAKVIFSKFYPIRIIDKFRTIEYIGYSEDFREVVETDPIPKYEAIFTGFIKGKERDYTITFKEIK